MAYEPRTIEQKWQAYWLENETFRVEIDSAKPKYYILDMFPYPSGDGLHVGHALQMTATDILARYKRMRGFNVLHPMGWDAFGLPAEQYAIRTSTHPRLTTGRNIANFKRQIRALGFSYDWSRELDTTDPSYTKWTQWIFRKLYEKGLAYRATVSVNWCPELGTVLANEEVIDGKSEIGGHPVVRLPLKQWMLRITQYAERLIEDLDDLDWPEPIKKMQREWIGRSIGARVQFRVEDMPDTEIEVFTTRPDTLFGATYLVLAPEHPIVDSITSLSERGAVSEYKARTQRRSERDRLADAGGKTGVFTGATAINPVTAQAIPIWIADYVLAGYGTGAIMAVPGHDQRDHDFARTFDLPILEVVSGGNVQEQAYTGEGTNVASGFLDGLKTPQAKERICEWLSEKDLGESTVTYKLRDWLFSRQRYWGEPFPIIHLEDGTTQLIPEDDLPLTLPELDDFTPSGKDFEAPLARVSDWVKTTDPKTGRPAQRDVNTMPQWAGSCWYFLRFIDPHNENEPWSKAAEEYWMPVDLYIGGAEHAVLHLLYARFWHKVFFDLGLVHTKEPFQKLLNQGMILGESFRYYDDNIQDDPSATVTRYSSGEIVRGEEGLTAGQDQRPVKARWLNRKDISLDASNGEARLPGEPNLKLERVMEKMSKSRGNVINPDDVISRYGSDSIRLYEMFIGPLEKEAPWSTDGIQGIYRFLQRCWRLIMEEVDEIDVPRDFPMGAGSAAQAKLTSQTVAGVTTDLEAIRFNTAISKLMVFVRDITRDGPLPRDAAEKLIAMLAPFAPHLAEELWSQIGHTESLSFEPWPLYDESLLVDDEMTLILQINGKKRGEIRLPNGLSQDEIEKAALDSEQIQRYLEGRTPRKIILVPGRVINIVG